MNKEKLLRIFGNYLDKIFTEINIKTEKLEGIKNDIQGKTLQFADITDEYDRVVSEIKKEKEELRRDKSLLLEQQNKAQIEQKGWVSKKDKIGSEIISVENDIKVLKEKKERLQKETQNVGVLESIKQNLTKDIIKLKNEYENTNKELLEIKEENKQDIIKYKEEVESIRKEKQAELDRVTPTIEELEVKQKQLTQKEKGLSIIEKRYKKLFEEQGGGFKV